MNDDDDAARQQHAERCQRISDMMRARLAPVGVT